MAEVASGLALPGQDNYNRADNRSPQFRLAGSILGSVFLTRSLPEQSILAQGCQETCLCKTYSLCQGPKNTGN